MTQQPLPQGPGETRAAPGRRERNRSKTRERLFRAALALFAERGFTATTVEDITEAADHGKGTFFNYFPSKEHVLEELGALQLSKIQAALDSARRDTEPMQGVLHRLIHALAEEPGRSPALVRSLLMANLSSEPVRLRMQENLQRGRGILSEVLALAQERGEVRRDIPAQTLAFVFQQTFFGALMMWSFNPAMALDARFDAAFPLLWSGMRAGHEKQGKEKLT